MILVTGAGKGLGRAVAQALAAEGAIVAANDVSPVNLDETVRCILAAGGCVKAYVEDIAKRMPVQALVQSVVSEWGKLDGLVNCAEVEPRFPVLDMDDWDWQRTIDVNLTGAFLLTQAAAIVMRGQRGGIIIHVGERAKAEEERVAYWTSKAGLAMMVKRTSQELADFRVQVFLVRPVEGEDTVSTICSLFIK